MRVAHLSDLHIDEHNGLIETAELLNWSVKDIRTRRPDAILIAGDSFPVSVRPSTPLERVTFRGYLWQLREIAPVVVIRGNHDVAEHDLDIFAGDNIHVFTKPGVCLIGDALIGGFPWPSKAFLLAQAEQTGQSIEETCRDAMKGILRMFAQLFREHHGGPRILVAHLNVLGVSFGGFTPIGQDVEVTAEDLLATDADWIALGHIHKHQMFGTRAAYSGSMRPIDFGEEGEDKGYLIVDVNERGLSPHVQFIYSPIRKRETIEVDINNPFGSEGKQFRYGGLHRLIVKVDEEARESVELARLLQQLSAGADVKVEWKVTPRQRVRVPEMAAARTDSERVRTYLETLEPKPEGVTIERVLRLLEQFSPQV